LFVVEVRESVAKALIEHEGHAYVSPPQDRRRALELIALLLGHAESPNDDCAHVWHTAIAGGQRSVELRRVA
jgi:hypothetical protein